MPKYYFRIEDGEPLTDPTPEELPDDAAAKSHARAIAQQLQQGRIDAEEWFVHVTNEAGDDVAKVPTSWGKKQ